MSLNSNSFTRYSSLVIILGDQPDDDDHDVYSIEEIFKSYIERNHDVRDLLCSRLNNAIMKTISNDVKRLILLDFKELSHIDKWLSSRKKGRCNNLILRYEGIKTDYTSVIFNVNPCITQIDLPLKQNIKHLLKINPHLTSVGINGDLFSEWHTLSKIKIDLHIWVSTTELKANISYMLKKYNFNGNAIFEYWG